MPDLVDRLREKMSNRRQSEMAALLGVNQSTVSRFLDRTDKMGPKMASALVRAFPDLRQEVIDFLLSENMLSDNGVGASPRDPAPVGGS